jgi:membrane-anchored protein YejM (alkaline phosphatase superfamily)
VDQGGAKTSSEMVDFREIVKKAYDRGLKESDLTLAKLMEELEADLKNMIVG